MIKAIETTWNGVRFRSRTEARWAAFFSQIRLDYQYEMEGFHLKSGEMYVPDFWIPEENCWIEIKGTSQNHCKHVNDLFEVCEGTSSFGFVFVGQPLEMKGSFVGCESTDSHGGACQETFNAGICRPASKEALAGYCVDFGSSSRSFFTADFKTELNSVWDGCYRSQWRESGVYEAALNVSKIRFW